MKRNKLVTGVVLSMMIAPSFLVAAQSVYAESIKDLPIVEVPDKNTSVSEKYDVSAGFIKNKTKVTAFGGKTIQATNDEQTLSVESFVDPSDDLKGKIGFVYEPTGLFEGKEIALKMTFLDWHKAGFKGGEWFGVSTGNSIGLATGGYGYTQEQWGALQETAATTGLKVSFELINPKTGKVIPEILGNFLNINDIDALQSVIFDELTTKNIEKMFVTDDTWVNAEYLNGNKNLMISAPSEELSSNSDEFAMVTALFNGNKVVFDWTKDYSSYNLDKFVDFKSAQYPQYFSYTNKKLAKTEISSPTKLVTDEDETLVTENTVGNYLEGFEYEITHHVAQERPEFYFKEYALIDEVSDKLDVESIIVKDETDKDVSNYFDNQTKGNNIKLVAKSDVLKDAKFYGHDYKYCVKVKAKPGVDLSKEDIKNQAKVIINSEEKPTGEVITHFPPLLGGSQHKTILDSDGKEVDLKDVNVGDKATFKLDFEVANNKELVSFNDDLENILKIDAKDYKLVDSKGKDVTSDFDVKVEEKNEKITAVPKEPKKWMGQKVSMYVSGTVKDESFKDYIDDNGEVLIPNVGYAVYKEGKQPTEEVNLHLLQDKPKLIPQTGGENNIGKIFAMATSGIVLGSIVLYSLKGKKEDAARESD